MTDPLAETKAKLIATEQTATQRSQATLGIPNVFHTAAENDVLTSRVYLADVQRYTDAASGALGSVPTRNRTIVAQPLPAIDPLLATNQPTKQGIPVEAKLVQQDGQTYYLGSDGQVIQNI